MNLRLFAGSQIAFLYNAFLTHVPSRTLRHLFLRLWLGRFGDGSGVQRGCRFLNGRKVELGTRNVINFGCLFDGRRYRIITGDDVSIGPEATLLTLEHDCQSSDFNIRGGNIVIGNRVWIAARAIILPGVNLGEGCVVGAGAVVRHDVPAFTIVAGNPARVTGTRSKQLDYQLSYHPWLL